MRIAIILAISFLVGSYAFVYADERVDDSIIVPFDFNGRICGVVENGNYVCEWDPNRIDVQDAVSNGTATIPNPEQAQTTLCPDNFELADDNVTCLPVIEEVIEVVIPPTYREKQLDKYEVILERLLEIQEPDSHEREYIALLKSMGECRSGYGQSLGVFEDRWFPISYTWINDGEAWLKSFDYTGLEAQLHKGIEECKAVRTVLNPVILGQWYQNRADADMFDRNIYHGDIASDVPIWSQSRVNDEANNRVDYDIDVCDYATKHYSEHTKRYYGCPTVTDSDPAPFYQKNNGVIEYANEIEDRWLQYLEDGGKAQTKELMQKVIEDKIHKLRESLRIQNEILEGLD